MWFLSWRDESDKTYPIAPEVRYVAWPVGAGLRRIFCFLTNQTKLQMLDYGQTTSKLNVSGIRPFVKITTLLWVASKRGHETKKHVLTEGCQTWCVFLPNIWSLTAVKANCRTKRSSLYVFDQLILFIFHFSQLSGIFITQKQHTFLQKLFFMPKNFCKEYFVGQKQINLTTPAYSKLR